MPTMYGTLPDHPGPLTPCRWCGDPTDLAFAPPGSKVGPVPLHMVCSMLVMRAYERAQAGRRLTDREASRLRRFLPDHAAATG